MADRLHLTIGEVLSLLREEFPDVSISKIRFLESQGLVDPERTPSGYRKFYDQDVERLRWILRQQREHFLPLKVIRGRLTGDDGDHPEAVAAVAAVNGGSAVVESVVVESVVVESALGESALGESALSESALSESALGESVELVAVVAVPGPEPVVATADAAPAPPVAPHEPATTATSMTAVDAGPPSAAGQVEPPQAASTRSIGARSSESPKADAPSVEPAEQPPAPQPSKAEPRRAEPPRVEAPRSEPARRGSGDAPTAVDRRPAPSAPATPAAQGPHPDVYTAAELANHVGCPVQLVTELVQFGIVTAGASVGGVAYFDHGAVALARIGARFSELGVEPRHLRTWRNAAEREAGLFEQLVMPLLRQRNPQARQQVAERLEELTRLGGDLREGLLAEAIRQIR